MTYEELVEKFHEALISSVERERTRGILFSLFKEAYYTCKHWTELEFHMDVYARLFPVGLERTATSQRFHQEKFEHWMTVFCAWWYAADHADFNRSSEEWDEKNDL